MRIHIICFFLLFGAAHALAQVSAVSSGQLIRHEQFPSRFVAARHVDVWLPEGYDGKKKFSVLYMHDGQMLFDSAATWNKQEWGVDETMSRLMQEGKIPACIVVGIWNSGQTRGVDYFPQKPFERMTKAEKDSVMENARKKGYPASSVIQSDAYLNFIVQELKPFIDAKYRVYKDRKHTFMAGSSMGGLISMYAICEYPKVFGGAACLSTHWPGVFEMPNNPIPAAFLRYLETALPSSKKHKLYFDYGTVGLDASYKTHQNKADLILRAKGFTEKQWITREFVGEDHTEKAWRTRLHIPLLFLMERN